jgi:hypothetical protein
MADSDLIVLDGSTFWSTDANGDVEARRHEGFFGKLRLRGVRFRGKQVDT